MRTLSYQCARMFLGFLAYMFLPPGPNTCRLSTARPRRHRKTSYSTCPVGLDYCNAVLAGLPGSTLAPFERDLQSSRGSSTSRACYSSQVAFGTHVAIHLGPSDAGCQNSGPIYTTHLVAWQPRRAADTSTNRRHSFFCCCTASMEQAADGAETAAIEGLVSS